MAELFKADGEDAGSTPWEFDGLTENGSCTFALDAAAKYAGSYGYKLTYDGANIVCYGSKGFTPQGEVYFGVRFKIDPLLAGVADSKIMLFQLRDDVLSQGLTFPTIELDGSGDPLRWACYNRIGGYFYSTQNFTLGVWHYWLVYFKKGTDNLDGGWIHKIDGIEIYNSLIHDVAVFNADDIEIGSSGLLGANPVAGSYIYYDDILVDTEDPTGIVGGGLVKVVSGGIIKPKWFGWPK